MKGASMMKNTLVLTVLAAIAATVIGEGRQQAAPSGLVIEAIQKGSAIEQAGLHVGDILISWTRSVPPSAAPVAQGEFRSPFDAREFELEQLPRGGTSVVVVRGNARMDASLIPGFWGVTARPTLSESDLAGYEAGRALEKDDPAGALARWQPLIDQSMQVSDVETAAWLLTRAASAMVALKQVERGDDLFERAASLFKTRPNPSFEAVVWEAKGDAYYSDVNPELTGGAARRHDRRTFEVALASHERARGLRAVGRRTLAEAESQLRFGVLREAALRNLDPTKVPFLPVTSDSERVKFLQVGARMEAALALIADQARGSFLHARALLRYGNFVSSNNSNRVAGAVEPAQATAAGQVLYREAAQVFEAVAPKHPHSYVTSTYIQLPADPQAAAAALRRRAELAAELGNEDGARQALRQIDARARTLARTLVDRGAYDEAIAIIEDLRTCQEITD